jgi:multiple antibiotic resistance protein
MWWQSHLSEFVTLFLVINPFAALPIFMAATSSFDQDRQRQIALTAVLSALTLLIVFVVGGNFLLRHLGIGIRAFQIAGGIVLFLVALDMIYGRIGSGRNEHSDSWQAVGIYPLAFPVIAGPGSMVTVIVLTDDDRFNFSGQLVTIGVIAAVLVIQLVLLLGAAPISRTIGATGVSLIGRIMGMLLAALAVSMVLSAIAQWLGLPQLA